MSDIIRLTHSINPAMLESAYREAAFPMADPDDPGVFTWHRPRRRAILPLHAFHVSHSLARTIRQGRFTVTYDQDFPAVMRACAARPDVWITEPLIDAYTALHSAGKAHSVEVFIDGQLVGGVYGVHLGGAFFAESKFHSVRDMSKVALAHLVFRLRQRGFALLEVQYLTTHLAQFGVTLIPDHQYRHRLAEALALNCQFS